MIHGLDNRHLYAAYKLKCAFDDGGNEKNICGTGFWIQIKPGSHRLITNRHLLDPGYNEPGKRGWQLKKIICSGKSPDSQFDIPNTDHAWILEDPEIKYSATTQNDIACINPSSYTILDGSTTAKLEYFLDINMLATKEEFELDIKVCDFVAYPGFPEWHDKLESRPIMRTGTIASDPRANYSTSSSYLGECIAYEAFSSGGGSGSPVFAIQKGLPSEGNINFPFRPVKLIGINAGHINGGFAKQSGISYMYKSSAILDLLNAK